MPIKTIIVDDEQLSIDVLIWELEGLNTSFEILATTNDPIEALKLIKNLKPELVFLDIEMPKLNGLELLNQIEDISFNVIFTTAYDHYALEAIKKEALDYLLKPIQKEELEISIQRHLAKSTDDVEAKIQSIFSKLLKQDENGKIIIPTSEGLEFVKIQDIIRCESSSNYTYIYKKDGSKLLVSKTLKDIEAMLPDTLFKRIHKSHLINFNSIEKYLKSDGGWIVLEDGSQVPISRNKKGDFLGQF